MKCTHNLQENVLGTVVWEQPIEICVTWSPTNVVTFSHVMKLEVMKTGCYVLHQLNENIIVLPQGYQFLVEREMPL